MKFNLTKYLLCAALGACLVFAFAPYDQFYLSLLAPGLLWYLSSQTSTPKQALLSGLSFGIGLFTFGIYWVFISIHDYGQASTLIAFLLTGALILLLSCFYGGMTLLQHCTSKLTLKKKKSRHYFTPSNQQLFIFPTLWTLFEILRVNLMTGFPWLLLGNSQVTHWLGASLPVLGIYGCTWITACTSCCLITLLKPSPLKEKILPTTVLILISSSCLLLNQTNWTSTLGRPVKVAILQGNIRQSIKWSPQHTVATINTYIAMIKAAQHADLIVLPEAAFPIDPNQSTDLIKRLESLMKRRDQTLIFGAPTFGNNNHIYNSLYVLKDRLFSYHKKHLVPFGEYLPNIPFLKTIIQSLEIPMSNFIPGDQDQRTLKINNTPFLPLICYEVAYPFSMIKDSIQKAFIINISDDSWFGNSIAAAQQAQIAQARARETGRYIILSTNTGISGIINANGRFTDKLKKNRKGILMTTVLKKTKLTPIQTLTHFFTRETQSSSLYNPAEQQP